MELVYEDLVCLRALSRSLRSLNRCYFLYYLFTFVYLCFDLLSIMWRVLTKILVFRGAESFLTFPKSMFVLILLVCFCLLMLSSPFLSVACVYQDLVCVYGR